MLVYLVFSMVWSVILKNKCVERQKLLLSFSFNHINDQRESLSFVKPFVHLMTCRKVTFHGFMQHVRDRGSQYR